MDYTSLFYWLVVADNARAVFITFAILFGLIAVVSTLVNIMFADEINSETQGLARQWMWRSYPYVVIFTLLIVFTPSKKDSLLIVAGGGALNFLTTDDSTKQIPKEMSNFVLTELKNMAKDSEIDLNLKDQKAVIIEEAKKMTAEELMNKIKSDTIYKRILLE